MGNIIVKQHFDMDSSSRIYNLPAPGSATEPVRLQDLDNLIAGGISWKDAARVAVNLNVNLGSPGGSIDGIIMVTGDRFVVMGQTLPAQNGIYIFNGAASIATRAGDANTSDKLEQAIITIEEGTNAGLTFRQTQTNFVLESGSVVFTPFLAASASATESTAGIVKIATQANTDIGTDDTTAITPLKLKNSTFASKKYQTTITGAASSFVITHNLGTRLCHVRLFNAAYEEVMCGVTHNDANTVTLTFSTNLGATTLTVFVIS